MSASTFINYRSVDDIYNQIVDYLSKGYVTVDIEQLTFVQGTSDYTLANGNLVSIISIEGTRDDGHIIPPTGSFNGVSSLEEGTDYDMIRSEVETDDYGVDLYDQLSFYNNQLFKHNSTVYVTYVYYDENKKTDITSFSNGSIASMLARAMAIQISNLYAQNERLYNSGNLALATGDDLDNHGEIWGVERDEGSPSSGTVLVTATGGDLTVSTATAFVSNLAGDDLIFNATAGGTVNSGTSTEFVVVSVANGYKYNVGANSIIKIYEDNTLATEITTATVNNNAVKLDASINTFTGGTDRQTDESYRNDIYLQAYKVGRGTLKAIKSAIEDLDIVNDVKVFDWATNKDIANGIFNVMAVSNTGLKLLTDTASTTQINNVAEEYRPAGQSHNLLHPMAVMIDFSGTAVIDDDDYINRTAILTSIDEKITDYINNLKIGDDVVYAEIISQAMEVGGVYDFTIDKMNHTEFASNPIALNKTTHRIQDNEDGGGTTYKAFYQEVKFMSRGRTDNWTYSGATTFTTAYNPIVDSPTPSVYLAIDDGSGNYVRDPAYSIDWYSSNATTQITIDNTLGSGVNRMLSSGTDVLQFNYETAETDTINGVRIKLHGGFVSGTTSGTVKLEFWSGIDSPTSGTLLESGTIVVLSGTDDYEVTFSTPLQVGDPEVTYYVLVSGTSTVASGSYISLPIATSGTQGQQATRLYSGATAEILSGTWGQVINTTAMVHTMIVNSGVANIEIEGKANIPDVAVIYQVDVGSLLRSISEG